VIASAAIGAVSATTGVAMSRSCLLGLFNNLAVIFEKMLFQQLLDEATTPAYSGCAYFRYDQNVNGAISLAHRERTETFFSTSKVSGAAARLRSSGFNIFQRPA